MKSSIATRSVVWVVIPGLLILAYIVALREIGEARRFKVPPPGWEIVTDGEVFGGRKKGSPYVWVGNLKSKQEAIDRSWRYFIREHEQAVRDGRNPKAETPHKDWMVVP